METQSLKKSYCTTEDFKFEIEQVGPYVNLHCEVYNWKPSILRLGYSVLNSLIHECQKNNIEKLFTVTPNPRFAKLFGGTSVNSFTVDDIEYEVIVWELKQQS